MRNINTQDFQQNVEQKEIKLSLAAAQALFKDKVAEVLKEVDYGELLENAQNILSKEIEAQKTEKQLKNMFDGITLKEMVETYSGINTVPVNNTIRLKEAVLSNSMNKTPINNTVELKEVA